MVERPLHDDRLPFDIEGATDREPRLVAGAWPARLPGRLEQALQHLGSAVYGNARCYLAIRNRANVHMHLAEQLSGSGQPSLLPPQHELALSFYAKAMEEDWHVPVIFLANDTDHGPVRVRVETRITSAREEPSAQILRNSV